MELSSNCDAAHNEVVREITKARIPRCDSRWSSKGAPSTTMEECPETNSHKMGIFVLQNGANCPVVGSAQQYQGSVR